MAVDEMNLVAEMISNSLNLSLAFLTLYLSVVSGYLVVSYLVGAKLTKFQSSFVTILFVVFSLHFTLSSYGAFEGAHLVHRQYFPADSLGPSPIMNRGLAMFQVAGVLGCLKFMWDVRKGDAE